MLLEHFEAEYRIAPLDNGIIGKAVTLTQSQRLRGYDTVQLATALRVNASLVEADLPSLAFLAADEDLVAAARTEGLDADDPNHHP